MRATYGGSPIGSYELAVRWFVYSGGVAYMTNLRSGPFHLYVRVPDDSHLPWLGTATTPLPGHPHFPYGWTVPPDLHT